MSAAHPFPPVRPAARGGPRDQRRADAVDRLLGSLEALVRRHRALAAEGTHRDLHAELVAAEVAHELAITRSALLRHPPLRAVDRRIENQESAVRAAEN